jgi:anaerobic magnesium-protoporphyrin IX monomethyl ester cyclase
MHYRRLPALSVVCGRGCPYRCTFCSCAKVFSGKVTVRSPENVADEVRMLKEKWGAKELLFWDDTFGLSDAWTLRLCELLRPLDVAWSAWMRVDLVSPEVLREMARSGCWHVSYGVESGNQRVLDGIRKGFQVKDVRNAFRWTHEAGMEARGTYVLGLPGDDVASMRDTVELAVETEADYASFQLLTPYPGTELWDEADALGTFLSRDLDRFTIWHPVWVPRGMTEAQLSSAHRRAYRRFYFRPSYVLRRLRAVRNLEDLRRNVRGALSVIGLGGG